MMNPLQVGCSRRELLRGGVAAVAAAAIPQWASAAPRQTDFSFVVANDLHYRDQRCGEWFAAVIQSIREIQPRPAFIVLNGDLSDSGTREQLGAIREVFWSLPIPIYATLGNHDYSADGRRENYETIVRRDRNFAFRCHDWDFLCLDTTDGLAVYRTWVRGETLAWVDANLRLLDKSRPLFVFSHFPLARNWLRPLNADDLMGRLRGHDLRRVFCGHWHGWTERKNKGVSVTTGRSCSWWRGNHDGSKLHGYFLCRVSGDEVSHDFVPVQAPRGLV
jgi:3',5'-cyclic AMP phosphodiesterase CpdA